MKLNEKIIDAISKKLKIGMYAKVAARTEGITERTYYRWKLGGDELLKKATNQDGEIIDKEFKKLTDTEKLKCQFCQSVDRSDAEGEALLVATIVSAAQDDWKAALQILQRRFPQRWAQKDSLHVDAEVDNEPDELKDFEDEYFQGIPANKMKDVIAGMEKVIEGARNGKPIDLSKESKKIVLP